MLNAISDGIIRTGSERTAVGPESSGEKRLGEKGVGSQRYVISAALTTDGLTCSGESLIRVAKWP